MKTRTKILENISACTPTEARDTLLWLYKQQDPLQGDRQKYYKWRYKTMAQLGAVVALHRHLYPAVVQTEAVIWRLARLVHQPADTRGTPWKPGPSQAWAKLVAYPEWQLISARKTLAYTDPEWPMTAEECAWLALGWKKTRKALRKTLQAALDHKETHEH